MRPSAQVAVTQKGECKTVEDLMDLSSRWMHHCIPTGETLICICCGFGSYIISSREECWIKQIHEIKIKVMIINFTIDAKENEKYY